MSLLKTQVSFPSIFNVIKHNFFYTFLAQTYTFVLTKTRNEPKRPETSQEWVETTQNVKMLKLGKFGVFYQLSFFKFWAQMPYFRNFGPKSINFLIFTKLRIYPILNALISNLSFVFETSQVPKFGYFRPKVSTF